MRLILLFQLVTVTFANLYCQNVDTLYVTKNKITKEKGNFDYYYIIKHDSAKRFLYHVNLYEKSNSLKSKFTIQSKEEFINKSKLIKMLDKDDYIRIGKDISYTETGKLESESSYGIKGKIEYMRFSFNPFIKFCAILTIPSTGTKSVGLQADASASWRIMVFAPDSYGDCKNPACRQAGTPPRPFSANWRIWAGSDGNSPNRQAVSFNKSPLQRDKFVDFCSIFAL